MSNSNYDNQWWGFIYDQMMAELPDWLENNSRFYLANLKDVGGPILECACGTGLILLRLLQSGYNIYGFDISKSMLSTLQKNAIANGMDGISERISVQDLETFHYEMKFEAILIPTNAFPLLATQEAQIRALRNIYTHLAPGGKLLMDLRLAGMKDLAEKPEIEEGNWYTWKHPHTGLSIRQRVVGRYDFNNQLVLDRCFIEYEGQKEDFPMTSRYIFKEEFQLLLRLAGFAHWEAYSTPERAPLKVGLQETYSYWIGEKVK
jgi:SAM-dependent methyltransferase